MADRIVVTVKPWVGEYEFDIEQEPLTSLEWRWLKKISGYMPMTIDDGLAGGDPDLFIAFAVIALRRAGRIEERFWQTVADKLSEAPFDGTAIQYIGGTQEQEDEDGPPAEPAQAPDDSGNFSNLTSGLLDSGPRPIGLRDSEKSATSDRKTSAK